jgi:hypothetical protein
MKTKNILFILGGLIIVGGGIYAITYYRKNKKDSVPASAPKTEGEGVNVTNALDVFKNVLDIIQSNAPLTKNGLQKITKKLNDPKTNEYERSEITQNLKKKGYLVRYISPMVGGPIPIWGVNAGWIIQKA